MPMATVERRAAPKAPRCLTLLGISERGGRDEAPVNEQALNVPDPAPMPDDSLDVSQREKLVRTALKLLPPEQLDLVRLAFFDGLSHSEIAAQTGLPLGTVKSRLRLAFSRLRRALDDEGLDAPA